jgi:phosphoribosylglycinamide formyltransferase-1
MSKDSFYVVVCASGGGGNFQSIIDARDDLGIDIALLIVDRPCGAIERAKKSGISHILLDKTKGESAMFESFLKHLPKEVNLIVLAGFMPIIPAHICDEWKGKIINTHPSLLPKFGGKGMYGVRVQEAVMQAKEQIAGCTIHYVNSGIDEGKIILQKSIPVDYSETPWQLGSRVFKEENYLLVDAIRLIKSEIKNKL